MRKNATIKRVDFETPAQLLLEIVGVYKRNGWSLNSNVYVNLRKRNMTDEQTFNIWDLTDVLESSDWIFRHHKDCMKVALNASEKTKYLFERVE